MMNCLHQSVVYCDNGTKNNRLYKGKKWIYLHGFLLIRGVIWFNPAECHFAYNHGKLKSHLSVINTCCIVYCVYVLHCPLIWQKLKSIIEQLTLTWLTSSSLADLSSLKGFTLPKPQAPRLGTLYQKKDKPAVISFSVPTVLSTFLLFISPSLSVCHVSSCHGVDLWLLWGIRVRVVTLTVSSRGIGQGVRRECLQRFQRTLRARVDLDWHLVRGV